MKLLNRDKDYEDRLKLWDMIDEETLYAMVGVKYLSGKGRRQNNPFSYYAKELGIAPHIFYMYIRGERLPSMDTCKRILKDCARWPSAIVIARHWKQ